MSNDSYRCGIPDLKNSNYIISLKYQYHKRGIRLLQTAINSRGMNGMAIIHRSQEKMSCLQLSWCDKIISKHMISLGMRECLRKFGKYLVETDYDILTHSILRGLTTHLSHNMHDIRDVFHHHGWPWIPAWISNHIPSKCGIKLLIHPPNSTVAPLKFGNGQINSCHIWYGCNYLHGKIKVELC